MCITSCPSIKCNFKNVNDQHCIFKRLRTLFKTTQILRNKFSRCGGTVLQSQNLGGYRRIKKDKASPGYIAKSCQSKVLRNVWEFLVIWFEGGKEIQNEKKSQISGSKPFSAHFLPNLSVLLN